MHQVSALVLDHINTALKRLEYRIEGGTILIRALELQFSKIIIGKFFLLISGFGTAHLPIFRTRSAKDGQVGICKIPLNISTSYLL